MKSNWTIPAAIAIALCAAPWPGFSQQPGAPEAPRQVAQPLQVIPSMQNAIDTRQSPFAGAVTEGQPGPQELSLSLQDAIDRGLRNNLGQYLSKQQTRIALGQQ